MFNWFRNIFDGPKYPGDDMKKVIPFPEKVPYIVPSVPVPEKPAQTYYRLGLTDNNRVSFTMGYSEITLSKVGVQNLIEQLQVFRDQLQAETEEE